MSTLTFLASHGTHHTLSGGDLPFPAATLLQPHPPATACTVTRAVVCLHTDGFRWVHYIPRHHLPRDEPPPVMHARFTHE